MALQPSSQPALVSVNQIILKITDATLHNHVLMHRALLVVRMSAPEQAQVPAGIPAAMPQPAPHKHEAPVDVIAIARVWCCHNRSNLARQIRRNPFVGIKNQDPWLADRQSLQRPVFLRCVVLKCMLDKIGFGSGCNLARAIRGARVDHKYFRSPPHALEAGRQIFFFIQSGYQHRNRCACAHFTTACNRAPKSRA